MKHEQSVKWLWEFSKKILLTLTIMYCVERIYIMACIALSGNMDAISTFITSGTEVFIAGVITYGLKAGIENVIKIFMSLYEKLLDKLSEKAKKEDIEFIDLEDLGKESE